MVIENRAAIIYRALELFFAIGIFLWPGLCLSCDTDLMTLLTGKSPSDSFSQDIFRLASEANDLGQAANEPEAAGRNVHQLMKTWIRFDNQFTQAPPPWAQNDPNWKGKFKELADLIGTFDSRLREKKLTRLHISVLAFSRKLFGLLSAMPSPPEKRSAIRMILDFQKLWDAIEGRNQAKFREGVEALAGEAREYRGYLATPALLISQDFLSKVDQLEKLHLANPASLTIEMSAKVFVAETAFQEMNAMTIEKVEGK